MNDYQKILLIQIGEYLHCDEPNEAQRKAALEDYYALYDSLGFSTGDDVEDNPE